MAKMASRKKAARSVMAWHRHMAWNINRNENVPASMARNSSIKRRQPAAATGGHTTTSAKNGGKKIMASIERGINGMANENVPASSIINNVVMALTYEIMFLLKKESGYIENRQWNEGAGVNRNHQWRKSTRKAAIEAWRKSAWSAS